MHASLTLANDLEGTHTPPFLLWAAADSMVACALDLLTLAARGRRLEAAPDGTVQAAFRAGLARWCEAAEAVVFGVRNNDPSELQRASRALESGSREFRRMGVAAENAAGGPAGLPGQPDDNRSSHTYP